MATFSQDPVVLRIAPRGASRNAFRELSRELLSMLEIQRVKCLHDIVTLEESVLDLSTYHEIIWLQADEIIPARERQTVQSKKLMLTIVWNLRSFHLTSVLPKGLKFDTGGLAQSSGVWVEAKTEHPCRAHTTAMKKVPHLRSSPDLAPSDFSRFGHLKQLLGRQEFPDGEALVEAVENTSTKLSLYVNRIA
jgi:hypothetical protein